MADDSTVITSASQYEQYLHRQEQALHRKLAVPQLDITYGSYWVRFVDLDAAHIEFGRVLTLTEVVQFSESTEKNIDVTTLQAVTDRLASERDLVLSERYDRFHPAGQMGYAHRSHLWPIEERLYSMALGCDYDYRLLNEAGRFLLDFAFKSMRAHVVPR